MATYYWVGGNGTWDNASTANWSASSGGAVGAGPPNTADTAIFDANSGTGVCTVASTAAVKTLTFGAANITLSLASNFALSSGSVGFTAGTINLNSYTLTCLTFATDSSNTRAIQFGTGKIVLTFNGGTVWNAITATGFSFTGTPYVELNYSGSTGTRQIFHASTAGGTETNAVSFYVTGGTDIVAFRGRANNLVFTGFAGTFNATVQTTFLYGDLTLGAGMTFNGLAINFAATSGEKFIATNGVSVNSDIFFNGVGGTWSLQDDLTLSATKTFTLTNGTFNANTKNVSTPLFALGSGTKTLSLGSATWTVTGSGTAWNANTNVANLTVSASTATISMTSTSAKTFAGGGKAWPTLNQGGTGALTVQQSNTFANITNTVQPATITLTAGTTQTVTNFTASGTSGNLITLNSSSAGSSATLLDNSGVVSVSYLSIQDIAATGSADWQAYTSNGNVDAGNNIGWEFTNPAPILTAEYPVSFRSFTERRSF